MNLKPKVKRIKKNHTLSLDAERFERFKAICKKAGYSVSEVVDNLITEVLEGKRK